MGSADAQLLGASGHPDPLMLRRAQRRWSLLGLIARCRASPSVFAQKVGSRTLDSLAKRIAVAQSCGFRVLCHSPGDVEIDALLLTN